ncbi:MAG: hypothetical protein ACXWCG_12445, partial [Flavitalea sp.]
QILGFFLIVLACCKKENAFGKSKMDLLTGTKWQLTNLYHQEVGDNTIYDFLSIYYDSCERDDSYHFTKDHLFFRRDSTKVCAVDPHFGLYGGSGWAADSAFSKITFTSMLYSYDMEIKSLNENLLELNHSVIDYFLNKVIFTYRFRAIP